MRKGGIKQNRIGHEGYFEPEIMGVNEFGSSPRDYCSAFVMPISHPEPDLQRTRGVAPAVKESDLLIAGQCPECNRTGEICRALTHPKIRQDHANDDDQADDVDDGVHDFLLGMVDAPVWDAFWKPIIAALAANGCRQPDSKIVGQIPYGFGG